ncbi:MAG: hypothetical protein LBP86_01255 [Azoarcus sp.]|jgi:hypothetical protein|nr:hypothetical protein [Azoarcus sp.]
MMIFQKSQIEKKKKPGRTQNPGRKIIDAQGIFLSSGSLRFPGTGASRRRPAVALSSEPVTSETRSGAAIPFVTSGAARRSLPTVFHPS